MRSQLNRERTCRTVSFVKLGSLTDIVNDYIQSCRAWAKEELRFYSSQPSLHKAIEVSALARTAEGIRHGHQRRIPKNALEKWASILRKNAGKIGACRTFEQLIALLESLSIPISGIGPLAVYDTSQRISVFLGVRPKLVYLHAGTREGAKALGLDSAGPCIRADELPVALHSLEPYEVEDCLCIYKKEILALRRKY